METAQPNRQEEKQNRLFLITMQILIFSILRPTDFPLEVILL